MSVTVNEAALDERLGRLEQARSWSPRVVSKLESHIRSADDAGLFRVNPLRFAAEKGIGEAEAIDLFLHATAAGLFEMDWLLVCPLCGFSVESLRSLQSMQNLYHCNLCNQDHEAKLDDFIMITFTIAPSIRAIAHHRPEALSARDYCFQHRCRPEALAPDGTPWGPMMDGLTPTLGYLPPGETTRFELEVGPNEVLVGWDIDLNAQIIFATSGTAADAPQPLALRYSDAGLTPDRGEIRPGRVVVAVENTTARRGLFGVCRFPADMPHDRLAFAPFLDGKRLLTTQTFRDLFRSEVIRATEGIGVNDIALLFTDLKGSTALYDRIGDLNAFSLVQQHFDKLQDVTIRHGGAIIKTIGDAVMAAFRTPRDAAGAAVEMLREIDSFNAGQPNRELILKIGIHRGAAIAVTLNDRLDYFGQTVNIASRVQGLADAEEIYLTREVYEAPGVHEVVAPFKVDARTAQLRGVSQDVPVYRVATQTAA